jgi:aspartokinase
MAIVGANMKSTPGVCGTIFSALGTSRVNVRAVAQGNPNHTQVEPT